MSTKKKSNKIQNKNKKEKLFFYCVNQSKKFQNDEYEILYSKNNRKFAKSICPICNGSHTRFLKSDSVEEIENVEEVENVKELKKKQPKNYL